MRITDVKARLVRCEVSQHIKFAHMEIPYRNMILVEICTDEGITGYGEIDAFPTGDVAAIQMINARFRDQLVGKDPSYIQAIWDGLYGLFVMPMGRTRSLEIYCIGAIDMALWDIRGKALNQPIYKLLGASRDEVWAYASLSYAGPDRIADAIAGVKQQGFNAVKIRIGVNTSQDVEITKRAREAAGEDMLVMADVNSGWSRREASMRAKRLAEFNLSWIEEPLPSHDVLGMAELAARIDTPIALGEHQIFNRYDARELAVMKAGSIFQPDIRVGGISECKRIADVASAWDIPCIPHFFGNFVRLAAMSQLLGAISNYWLMEYDISINPLRTQLPKKPIEVRKSMVRIPDAPGLGADPDPELLEKWTVNI